MFLFFIVGSIFVAISLFWLWTHRYYTNHGKVLPGKVIGIEKYVSRSRRHGKSTFYRPIIQYTFQGNEIWFVAQLGRNAIIHKINEKVKVLSLTKGPEYVRLQTTANFIFPMVFFIVGSGLLFAFFYHKPSLEIIAAGAFGEFLVIAFLYNKIKKHKLADKLEDALLKANVVTEESLKDRTVIRSNRKLDEMSRVNHKAGLIITLVFFAPLVYICQLSYSKLKPKTLDILNEVWSHPTKWELLKDLPYQREPELIGFLACGVFSLLLAYSLIFQLRKMSRG